MRTLSRTKRDFMKTARDILQTGRDFMQTKEDICLTGLIIFIEMTVTAAAGAVGTVEN